MRIVLDTTYLLPIVGVELVGMNIEDMRSVLASGHSLMLNEVSLFEILGKVCPVVAEDEESRKRVETGLKAIMNSDRLTILSVIDEETLPVALDLMCRGMRDIPDVPIVASALVHADSLMTEAKDIPAFLRRMGSGLQVFDLKGFRNKR